MRTYTFKTTFWGDGTATVDVYNKIGEWVQNFGVHADSHTSEFHEVVSEKLTDADFENVQWSPAGEPASATRDEYRRERFLLAEHFDGAADNLPRPDENTDWRLEEHHEAVPRDIPEWEQQRSARRERLERRINAALPSDRQIWFHRDEEGIVSGWGSVPVQIYGLIGEDAASAKVSTPTARPFYFRLRSNTARLEVYRDRNVPRSMVARHDLDGDVHEVSRVNPVVPGDDWLGVLPDSDDEVVSLFVELVSELAAPDAFENPTGVQSMVASILSMQLSGELRKNGLEAADAKARDYLGSETYAPYAQKWLDVPDEEKLSWVKE